MNVNVRSNLVLWGATAGIVAIGGLFAGFDLENMVRHDRGGPFLLIAGGGGVAAAGFTATTAFKGATTLGGKAGVVAGAVGLAAVGVGAALAGVAIMGASHDHSR